MAAKVVMVAVPAVLGIASIRLQPGDVPMEGIHSPEKLSVYAPLPQTDQLQFIAEQPGALESGLTSLRGGVLPYIQTAQGAGLSVKIRTVNLYHAGQDMYHYLRDPPPGFLPRIGSIYLAGLVGMFITRSAGSGLRRVSVPVALMSAGAAVCFPAHTVALLKVTGRKLHSAGQWSRATASSLLATAATPRDPAPQTAEDSAPSSSKAQSEPGPSPPTGPSSSAGAAPDPGPAPDPGSSRAARRSDSELMVSTPALETEDFSGTPPDPVMMDYGQSDPEDADMYSTRS